MYGEEQNKSVQISFARALTRLRERERRARIIYNRVSILHREKERDYVRRGAKEKSPCFEIAGIYKQYPP